MKKLLLLAAVLVMLLPVSAMAGMTAFMDMNELSSSDMSDVTGQTGITIYATLNINNGYVSWSDDDGFGGLCSLQGFVTLATIQSTGINLDGLTIDACNDGVTTYVTIYIPTLTLNQSISAIRLGTSHAVGLLAGGADNMSLGRIDQSNVTLDAVTLKICAH